MVNIIIGQGLGFVALFFVVLSFQSKERDRIMFYQIISAIFYSLNLFMLGGLAGAVTMMIAVVRNYVYSQKDKKKWANHSFWLFLFLIIFIISGIYTYKNVFSLLPIIGVCLGTIAFWMSNPKHIRFIAAITPPLWATYDYISGSIGGVVLECIYFLTVIIGIVRFDIMKQPENKGANIS